MELECDFMAIGLLKNVFICVFRVFFLLQFVSIYAAYLYDSVKLYAWALDKLLKQEPGPLTDDTIYDIASNGTRIIETIIKNKTYKSEFSKSFR